MDGIGVHPGHIRRLERGQVKRPREENLTTLAGALGVTTQYLLHGSDTPPPATRETMAGPLPTPEPRRSRSRGWRAAATVAAAVAVFLLARSALAPDQPSSDAAALDVRLTDGNHRIEAFDGRSGQARWFATFRARIVRCEDEVWNGERVVLVGLDRLAPEEAAGFLVFRVADGSRIVSDLPDGASRAENVRFMGPSGRDLYLSWTEYPTPRKAARFADVDGDGRDEMIVPAANIYGDRPSRLRVYEDDGSVRGTFYVTGSLNFHLAGDFDEDGKDEILLSTTSGDPRRRGFSLLLLDDEHLEGVSPDALDDPACGITTSCARAVTLPAFDEPYMEALGSLRLQVWDTQFIPRTSSEPAHFIAYVGVTPDIPAILHLDMLLAPIRVTHADVFRRSLDEAPEGLRERLLNEHLAEWAGRHELYPQPHVARSAESDDAPQY